MGQNWHQWIRRFRVLFALQWTQLVDALDATGYFQHGGFLGCDHGTHIYTAAMQKYSSGLFKKAAVGQGMRVGSGSREG